MTDAPAWARGQDIAWLKEIAGVFRADFKPHTYGAFGIPKERDIATAMSSHDLIWTKARGGVAGAAIARVASHGSSHTDFAGRKVQIETGHIFVKAIAGAYDGMMRLLLTLQSYNRPIWIEGHVENGRLRELLGSCGYTWAMTKISASSDLKGMWVRAPDRQDLLLPPPLDHADIPSIEVLAQDFVDLSERAAISLEIAAAAQWTQHYPSYNKRKSWTAFALQGYDAKDPGFIIKPSKMSKQWKDDNPDRLAARCQPTALAHLMPTVMQVVRRIPGSKQRIRLMKLAASGGELTRHADITDPEAGTADGHVARLHIPITTSPGCLFSSWGIDGARTDLHMPERSLCYLDTRKPHAVANAGADDRIHLVVDTYAGPELRAWLARLATG